MTNKFMMFLNLQSNEVLADTVAKTLTSYCVMHNEIAKEKNTDAKLYLEGIKIKQKKCCIYLREKNDDK